MNISIPGPKCREYSDKLRAGQDRRVWSLKKKKGRYWNPILGGGGLWVTEEGGKSQLQTVRSKLVHWMFRELGSGQRQWGPVSCRDGTQHSPVLTWSRSLVQHWALKFPCSLDSAACCCLHSCRLSSGT